MSGGLLTAAVLAVFACFAAVGYARGFFRTLFVLLSWAVSLILMTLLIDPAAAVLKKHTPVYEKTFDFCRSEGEGYADEMTAFLPDSFCEALDLSEAAEDLQDAALDRVSGSVAGLAVRAGAFVLCFVLIALILRLTLFSFRFLRRVRVIRWVDRLGGLALGILLSTAAIWIFQLVLLACCGSAWSREVLQAAKDSSLLSFFFDHNLLLHSVAGAIGFPG